MLQPRACSPWQCLLASRRTCPRAPRFEKCNSRQGDGETGGQKRYGGTASRGKDRRRGDLAARFRRLSSSSAVRTTPPPLTPPPFPGLAIAVSSSPLKRSARAASFFAFSLLSPSSGRPNLAARALILSVSSSGSPNFSARRLFLSASSLHFPARMGPSRIHQRLRRAARAKLRR